MKVLAIETATESCSATLEIDGERFQQTKIAPRQHTELILPMIEQLLGQSGIKKQELDLLSFGRGPGAFTGVRIATGIIQGLAYSLNKPVVAISSLRALAQAYILEHEYIATAFDARMGEVYWGCYKNNDGVAELIGKEKVLAPDSVELTELATYLGVGTGFGAYESVLQEKIGRNLSKIEAEVYPNAHEVLELALVEYEAGNSCVAGEVSPVYLRDKVV